VKVESERAPVHHIEQLLGEMAATSDHLAGASDIQDVLQRLAMRAREITLASFAAASLFDEEGLVERFLFDGVHEGLANQMGSLPSGRGLLGQLSMLGRPLRLDDLTDHPAFSGWPDGHPAMGPFIGMPIRSGDATIGSLYVTRGPAGRPFTELDELSTAFLSIQAAQQINIVAARERTARLSLLEERENIARDLHDGTIQSLYALGLESDAQANAPDFPEQARPVLEHVVERINEVIRDMRGYITMLESQAPAHAPDLARDIPFAVQQLVPSSISVLINVNAETVHALSAREAEDLLYITREALSNAVRHGAPTRIAIEVRQTDTETALTVQDNGAGYDAANVRSGLGTVTMRTRAESLGATLSSHSIVGMGTSVRVSVPRPEAPDG
jgi:two-component system, NarL family, sensor histidine kinase DevS